MPHIRTSVAIVVALALGNAFALRAQEPQTQNAQVAALKQSVQQGLMKARQYEWIETTIIRLKGEEKGRKQNRCYYGADGKVVKIALEQPAQQDEGRRGRGEREGRVKEKVIENKTDDLKDYMQRAGALIQEYVPPDPMQIQAAQDAGRVAVTPQTDGSALVVVSQYKKQGDSLSINFNGKTTGLLGMSVNSYLDKPADTVTLVVKLATLPDGALYAGETTLDAKAKNITVVIQNAGYKPVTK